MDIQLELDLPKCEYFFVGLEAKLVDNRFENFDRAYIAACYAAHKVSLPVRIFAMLPNAKGHKVCVVQPQDFNKLPIEKLPHYFHPEY